MRRAFLSTIAGAGLMLGLAGAGLTAPADGGAVADLGAEIPKKIAGFEAAGKDLTFTRETLYDYMDGGAEVYLAFDLRGVWARKYKSPSGAELALDVYDMGSPGEAFGALSCDREDPSAGVGQESTYGGGLLRFWQGRYFVTVTASSDDPASTAAVLELGKEAAKHLGPEGPRPDLLALLPAQSLRPGRTSFFHSVVNLNNRFFISSENILGLDRTTDCVLGEYGAAGSEPMTLLLIRYPSPEKAASARRSFLASYLPEAGPDGLARTENRKWVSASAQGNSLTLIFDAPSVEAAKTLRDAVRFPAK